MLKVHKALTSTIFYLLTQVGCNSPTTLDPIYRPSQGEEQVDNSLPAVSHGLESIQFDNLVNGSHSTEVNPQISGKFNSTFANRSLKIFKNNSCTLELSDVSTDSLGNFLVTDIVFNLNGSSDGTYQFYASFGENCLDLDLSYTLDRKVPLIPFNLGISGLAVHRNSNNPSPVFYGTSFDNGATVQLFTDNTCSAMIGSSTVLGGSFTVSNSDISSTPSNTTLEFYIKLIDQAGNQSSCFTTYETLIFDTTAPTPGAWTLVENGTTSWNSKPLIQVSGTFAATDESELYSDIACTQKVNEGRRQIIIGVEYFVFDTISYNEDGSEDGLKTFYAKLYDIAGNTSGCLNTGLSYTFAAIPFTLTLMETVPSVVFGPVSLNLKMSDTISWTWNGAAGNSRSGTFTPHCLNENQTPNIFGNSYGGTHNVLRILNAQIRMCFWADRISLTIIPLNYGDVSVLFNENVLADKDGQGLRYFPPIQFEYRPMKLVKFQTPGTRVSEKAGLSQVVVELTETSTSSVAIDYEVVNTNPTVGSYHDLAAGTIVIPAGQLQGNLSFTPVDSTDAFSRSFEIRFSGVTSVNSDYFIGKDAVHQVTIIDDETSVPGIKSLALGKLGVINAGETIGHQCMIATDDSLWCWGDNTKSEVGDSTITYRSTPVLIDAGTSYKKVVLAETKSCAITSANLLKCWGNNNLGSLIGGGPATITVPTLVEAVETYKDVSIGTDFSCGVTFDGRLKCWGSNSTYQVGDGTTTARTVPTHVDVNTIYQSVKSYGQSSCGMTLGGMIKCWGSGSNGVLANGSVAANTVPKNISANSTANWGTVLQYVVGMNFTGFLNDFKAGAGSGSQSTCLVYSAGSSPQDGTCVGGNITGAGVIGMGNYYENTYQEFFDTQIQGLCLRYESDQKIYCLGRDFQWGVMSGAVTGIDRKISDLDIEDFIYSDTRAVAKLSNGVWGYWGKLGTGLDYLEGATEIAVPGVGNLALGINGGCISPNSSPSWCWGEFETHGKKDRIVSSPSSIELPSQFIKISLSSTGGCGIGSDGSIKCWGTNAYGQVGDGSLLNKDGVSVINSVKTFTEVSAAAYHACAIDSDKKLYCWGSALNGKLGNSQISGNYPSPVEIMAGTLFKKVSTGLDHTCAIADSNKLYCWGSNVYGQVGVGGATSSTPQLLGAVDYLVISARADHTCAIDSSNKLFCWGRNNDYQIGNGLNTNVTSPLAIDAANNYSKVVTAPNHTCGILQGTGALKCWGSNTKGAVGVAIGTATVSTPSVVDSGVSYQEVEVSSRLTCAFTSVGIMKCFGLNDKNQIPTGLSNRDFRPFAF